MKAMIQKDLRENLKLALIGLLIFSLLLLQAYQTCISTLTNMLTGNSSGQIGALASSALQAMTTRSGA